MDDFYKVEGNGDLARDPLNGAILNVNSMEHDRYVHRRDIRKLKNEVKYCINHIKEYQNHNQHNFLCI